MTQDRKIKNRAILVDCEYLERLEQLAEEMKQAKTASTEFEAKRHIVSAMATVEEIESYIGGIS